MIKWLVMKFSQNEYTDGRSVYVAVTEPELKLANDDMQFVVHTELVELRY